MQQQGKRLTAMWKKILRNYWSTSGATALLPKFVTIKGYDEGVYLLGFPNNEVRQSLYEAALPR